MIVCIHTHTHTHTHTHFHISGLASKNILLLIYMQYGITELYVTSKYSTKLLPVSLGFSFCNFFFCPLSLHSISNMMTLKESSSLSIQISVVEVMYRLHTLPSSALTYIHRAHIKYNFIR